MPYAPSGNKRNEEEEDSLVEHKGNELRKRHTYSCGWNG
jgi:hypothetical protein